MQKIVKLWFVLAVAVGMMCASVQAAGPEDDLEYEGGAATKVVPIASGGAQVTDQVQPTLDGLPQELFNKIVGYLDPYSAAQLAQVSRKMRSQVDAARQQNLDAVLFQESKIARDPTGKALPNLEFFFLTSETSVRKVDKALLYLSPERRKQVLDSVFTKYGGLFVVGGKMFSVMLEISTTRIENLYSLILQALDDKQGLTNLQKMALEHLFAGYDIMYKDEAKRDEWLANFQANVWAPEAGGGLLAFINNTYREITAETQVLDLNRYYMIGDKQFEKLENHIKNLLSKKTGYPPEILVGLSSD